MLTTFVVYLQDKSGVLERVTGLIRRRGFEIQSLSIGQTEMPGLLRMSLVADTGQDGSARLEANLCKLPYVVRAFNVASAPCLFRELVVIKLAADREERSEIMQIALAFRSRVVDICPGSIIVECAGGEQKINALVEILGTFGILEMARTGRVAMVRGLQNGAWKSEAAGSPNLAPTHDKVIL